jgi:ribosomal protein S25
MFYDEIWMGICALYEKHKDENIKFRINTCGKLYLKSIQTCIDLLTLFEKGSLTSSFLLWRSIYNDFVIAKFLANSEEEISSCYNEYAEIQKHFLFSGINKLTEKEISESKKKYGKNLKNNYNWAINIERKRDFDEIRKRIKEEKYYTEYKFASMYHHASSFSVNNSVFYDNEHHGNTNMLGYFSENIEIPYNLTVSVMKDFTDVMLEIFFNDERKICVTLLNEVLEKKTIIIK